MTKDTPGPILIVDEHEDFRNQLVALLSELGYQVEAVTSTEDATKCIAEQIPVLAIVDWRSPGQEGWNWIKKVREQGKQFPIVALTDSWCDSTTFHWLRNILTVSLILQKPIVPELFIHQIGDFLPSFPDRRSSTTESQLPEVGLLERLRADAGVKDSVAPGPVLKPSVRQKIEQHRAVYVRRLIDTWNDLSSLISCATTDANAAQEAALLAHKIRGTAGSLDLAKITQSAIRIEESLILVYSNPGSESKAHWEEILSALGDGACAIEEAASQLHFDGEETNIANAAKILILCKSDHLPACTSQLNTSYPVEIDMVENPARALAKTGSEPYSACFIDLSLSEKQKLFDFTRAIRSISGHEALPLGLVADDPNVLSAAEQLYIGSSINMSSRFDKATLETAVNQLLHYANTRKPRILVMDDDEQLNKMIATTLDGFGMVVKTLSNPVQIVKVARDFRPDLVILDVVMPGMSGYDACRMLRTLEECKNTAVLFLTARSDPAARRAAYYAGANDFLVKPVLPRELLARVRSQLDQASLLTGRHERDPLTGALTRGEYMIATNEALEFARAHSLKLSVALMTIDGFVSLLLSRGMSYVEGGVAALGKLLSCRFRAEEIRGRWGDEGFALTFMNQEHATVRDALSLLLEEFMSPEKAAGFRASFSAGIATYPQDGTVLETLLTSAQKRLIANSCTTVVGSFKE